MGSVEVMVHTAGARLGAEAARRLAAIGRVQFGPPMTDADFTRVDDGFGFELAEDHRAFLAAGLPEGAGWPNWRDADSASVRASLRWPVEGVLFDVSNNAFWHDDWGPRPASGVTAAEVAREALVAAPQMVPVFGHRYLPAGRGSFGHPVMSIYQSDVICYGADLVDYVHQEFGAGPGVDRGDERWRPRPTVTFWSDLIG
jgi:hypothetical protein